MLIMQLMIIKDNNYTKNTSELLNLSIVWIMLSNLPVV